MIRWRVRMRGRWAQFKISCYELFLYLYWSRLGSALQLR